MRYVVLDTDVASRIIKRQLVGPLAAKLTAVSWCVTFVTVGELWQWAAMRSWGGRTRGELEDWLGGVVRLDSDPVISQEWGQISADARRRGRPRPANDTWIAACCLYMACRSRPSTSRTTRTSLSMKGWTCSLSGRSPLTTIGNPLGGRNRDR
jgi:toxin FitB